MSVAQAKHSLFMCGERDFQVTFDRSCTLEHGVSHVMIRAIKIVGQVTGIYNLFERPDFVETYDARRRLILAPPVCNAFANLRASHTDIWTMALAQSAPIIADQIER